MGCTTRHPTLPRGRAGEGECTSACCAPATVCPEPVHGLTLHQSLLAILLRCSEVRPHLQGQSRPRVMSSAVGGTEVMVAFHRSIIAGAVLLVASAAGASADYYKGMKDMPTIKFF